jgi:hypothetical protein
MEPISSFLCQKSCDVVIACILLGSIIITDIPSTTLFYYKILVDKQSVIFEFKIWINPIKSHKWAPHNYIQKYRFNPIPNRHKSQGNPIERKKQN